MSSAKNTSVEWRSYGGKPVAIFEDHAVAIIPWASNRCRLKKAPILITLDYHTDTLDAFVHSASKEAGEHRWPEAVARHLASLRTWSAEAAKSAAQYLRNDEHIEAAIQADIVKLAIVLCYSEDIGTRSIEHRRSFPSIFSMRSGAQPAVPLPPPPHHYTLPYNGIFIVSNEAALECVDDWRASKELERVYVDQAIDAGRLKDRLRQADEMSRTVRKTGLTKGSYILDIDLDYFRTTKSLTPADPSRFHKLIRNSALVTIALEPSYVRRERLDKEIESATSLLAIERHLIAALGSRDAGIPEIGLAAE